MISEDFYVVLDNPPHLPSHNGEFPHVHFGAVAVVERTKARPFESDDTNIFVLTFRRVFMIYTPFPTPPPYVYLYLTQPT